MNKKQPPSIQAVQKSVREGDWRPLSRLITAIENDPVSFRSSIAAFSAEGENARVVGITGSPGAGKSTLVDQLCREAINAGKRVAILAVDPTSPFSGGAVLGDRIRMNQACEESQVYIRSMATRGNLGGLARATFDVSEILRGAGFDLILVETVGVGQAEVDVALNCETTVVVLVPGMGDGVQALKAGILEIADVFVINKADHDGVDLVEKDIRTLLSLLPPGLMAYEPQIIRTVATRGEQCAEVLKAIDDHGHWFKNSPEGELKKERMITANLKRLIADDVFQALQGDMQDELQRFVTQCSLGEVDIYSAASTLAKLLLKP